MSTTTLETEVKIRWVGSASQALQHVASCGYQLSVPRTHEINDLYDRLASASAGGEWTGELRSSGQALRLRRSVLVSPSGSEPSISPKVVLTYKGPTQNGRYKKREELELEIDASGADTFETILQRLRYQRVFRYEKFRSVSKRNEEPGLITVDETPMGIFIELEGPESWIDATASCLGFAQGDYIVAGYPTLYEAHRLKNPNASSDMVFG